MYFLHSDSTPKPTTTTTTTTSSSLEPLQPSSCGRDVLVKKTKVGQIDYDNEEYEHDDYGEEDYEEEDYEGDNEGKDYREEEFKRIVGGQDADKHRWIWQAMLFYQGRWI